MNLHENGFEIVNEFIPEEWHSRILEEIEASDISLEMSGVRNIDKKLDSVFNYLLSDAFKKSTSLYLAENSKLVRAILFNKSPESNWFVTWHQDRTVAVSRKFESPDWRAWTKKENILHVQPPLEVLDSMTTIRIHLDSTPKENGCLKVIPNSHKLGILSSEEIGEIVTKAVPFFCEADRRAALIMKPHVLHASSKSVNPANRRILHLEFSNWHLPDSVSWA